MTVPDELFAHTPNAERKWHFLDDHLQAVAKKARSFADAFGAGDWGELLGQMHDIGKVNPLFQEYLKKCDEKPGEKFRGPVHSIFGALVADKEGLGSLSLFPLAGHHAGLSDKADLKQAIKEYASLPAFLEKFYSKVWKPPQVMVNLNTPLSAFFFTRMIFSCLVDADFLDTETHFDRQKAKARGITATLGELWELFHSDQKRLLQDGTGTINEKRAEIYQRCLEAAEMPKGVFTLTVPTGAGKTRSVMGFSLRHALKHGMERIIVAIPYTSIIEQNARVYKDIFGDDRVLEHHSQANFEDAEAQNAEVNWARLAAENWDVPIITTTTVQLFDSLFSNRPSACRKLHNLADSVIVLDEVQTLPTELLQPILFALSELVRFYRTTVVMSTATQPYFARPEFADIFNNPVPIVPEFSRYFDVMKRVKYHFQPEPQEFETVAARIRKLDQVLVVLNTKKDAIRLHGMVDQEDCFHLSTLLCPAHRAEILQEVRKRLAAGGKVKLISTQVVEAGVDLDFPVVMRAIGPLDRIVQAAGRCNREGRLRSGKVHIINLKGASMPRGFYKTGADHAQVILQSTQDLDEPGLHEEYFNRLFGDVTTDSKNIMDLQTQFKFATVAERFHLIPDNTEAVLVPYPKEEIKAILDRLDRCFKGWENARETLRACQPHLVNIYRYQIQKFLNQGLLKQLPLGLYLWLGKYDPKIGLVAEALDPEQLVF